MDHKCLITRLKSHAKHGVRLDRFIWMNHHNPRLAIIEGPLSGILRGRESRPIVGYNNDIVIQL